MKSFKTFNLNRRQVIGTAIGGAAAARLGAPSATFAAPAVRFQDGVTLEVWGGVPAENGPQALVDAFMDANPGITVNYTRYVNDDTGNTQLDTALQGGTPIDLFFTYQVSRLGQRIGAGAAADITQYVTDDAEINEWITTTDGIFVTEEGVYHAIPTTQEPTFLFINKNAFEDAGIEIPQAGWTIDEYVELSREMTGDLAFGTYGPPNTAGMKLGANAWYKEGGAESNFDDPAFAETYGRHRDMIDEGIAFPWTDVIAQNLRAYAQTPFLTEQVHLWVNSPWSLRYVNDKEQYPHDFVTTFAPLPKLPDVEQQYTGQGINNWILMGADTQFPDEAWQLMRYWLIDGAEYMLPAGKIPTYLTFDEETVVAGLLGPDAEELYDVEAFRSVTFDPDIRYFTDTITTGAAEITNLLTGLEDRLLIGEIDIDQFITDLKAGADDILAGAS